MTGCVLVSEARIEGAVDGDVVVVAIEPDTVGEGVPVAATVEVEVLAQLVEEVGRMGTLAAGREATVGNDALAE